jgi:hypothetical protein
MAKTKTYAPHKGGMGANNVEINEEILVNFVDFSCIINCEADTNFLVKSGVRQGCVMSYVLFIIAIVCFSSTLCCYTAA